MKMRERGRQMNRAGMEQSEEDTCLAAVEDES